jgi:hypothetical protein
VITSGRCHGPGCQQAAVIDFCSDECLKAWHELHGPPPPKVAMPRLCARCGKADCPEPLAEWEAELLAGVGARMACAPPEFTSASAAYPQVASPSPQVAQSDQTRGWLGHWLHRMRRTP